MSGLSKDLLVFDAAFANDSDNVGVVLRGASGEIVTSTLVSGKQALDVNMVNDINVEVSAADGDSIIISDGTDNLEINPDGSLNAVVTASNLDIRDLVFATDKVDVSGSLVSVSGDVNVTQGTSPWVVSATDLDIRDLTHVSDSIKVGDGTDFLAINADGSINTNAIITGDVADDAPDSGNPIKVGSRAVSGPLAAISAANDRADLISDLYRRVYINDSANIGNLAAAVSVADVAITLVASALGGRRELLVQNLSSQPIYVGHSGVTTANGTRIAAGASGSFKVGPNVALYAISANATSKDVRVLELA